MRADFSDFHKRIIALARHGDWSTPEQKLEFWRDAQQVIAVVAAMTHQERSNTALLAERERRERIATACGVSLAEIDQIVSLQKALADLVERMGGHQESGEPE